MSFTLVIIFTILMIAVITSLFVIYVNFVLAQVTSPLLGFDDNTIQSPSEKYCGFGERDSCNNNIPQNVPIPIEMLEGIYA